MSTVLIIAPIVISSWPAITAAVAAAAVGMGLNIKEKAQEAVSETQANLANAAQNSVEVELEQSQVLAENLATGQAIELTKDNLTLRVTRDQRGRCVVCAEGKGYSKAELKQIGQDFAGKVTQAFVYNRVKTELKNKGMTIVNEEVAEDQTVKIHVRHWAE